MKLIANQNETLDALLFRHYGAAQSARLVEIVLALNPNLANAPLLPLGQEVEIPDFPQHQQTIKPTIQLWT